MRSVIFLLAVLAGICSVPAYAASPYQKEWKPSIKPPEAGRPANADKWKKEEAAKDSAKPKTYCKDKRNFVPEIDVVLVTPDPVFNFTKSIKDLSEGADRAELLQQADTREKQVWVEGSVRDGLARGGSGFHTQSRFVGIPYGGLAALYCPFFKKVVIEIYYSSTLFIASDYKEGSCRYDHVVEHELTHHNINRKIITEYGERLEKDLPVMLAQIENYGYVNHDKINARFELMRQGIADAVDVYGEQAARKMDVENAKIDSLESYMAGSDVCRGKQ